LWRYVELLGEMRRGMTVPKMRGSTHDKHIREYNIDATGMHIGNAFREVGDILSGSPTRYVLTEEERMRNMFDEASSTVDAANSL